MTLSVRQRRITRQYGHIVAADCADVFVDFGVGNATMTSIERLTCEYHE